MKRALWLGLALVALLASMAAVTSSAFGAALPANLPEIKGPRTLTGEQVKGTTSQLNAGEAHVKCTEATSTGEEEAGKPLGPVHIDFKNCENDLKQKCTGEGEKNAGEILVLGTWHLVFDEKGTTFEKLTTAVLFLIKELKFTCGALFKITVLGEVACLHLNPTVVSKTHEFHCIGFTEPKKLEGGDNWCKEDVVVGGVDKCEGLVKPFLDVIVNGTLVEGEEIALGLVKTTEEISADV